MYVSWTYTSAVLGAYLWIYTFDPHGLDEGGFVLLWDVALLSPILPYDAIHNRTDPSCVPLKRWSTRVIAHFLFPQ